MILSESFASTDESYVHDLSFGLACFDCLLDLGSGISLGPRGDCNTCLVVQFYHVFGHGSTVARLRGGDYIPIVLCCVPDEEYGWCSVDACGDLCDLHIDLHPLHSQTCCCIYERLQLVYVVAVHVSPIFFSSVLTRLVSATSFSASWSTVTGGMGLVVPGGLTITG